MIQRIIAATGLALVATILAMNPARAEEVRFVAADGVQVFAELKPVPAGKTAPMILLFHQAGSNGRGEYGPIIPRLNALGFNVLALDQRSGGSYYGSANRTVRALGHSTRFCAAYADMEAALRYVLDQGFTGPRLAWGSSYSAALVLRMADEHAGDLTAVLSFSPGSGRAMGPCNANHYVDDIKVPVLALSPRSEMSSRTRQFERLRAHGAQTFVAEHGVHGSSMLVEARTHADTSATWAAVTALLQEHSRHAP